MLFIEALNGFGGKSTGFQARSPTSDFGLYLIVASWASHLAQQFPKEVCGSFQGPDESNCMCNSAKLFLFSCVVLTFTPMVQKQWWVNYRCPGTNLPGCNWTAHCHYVLPHHMLAIKKGKKICQFC